MSLYYRKNYISVKNHFRPKIVKNGFIWLEMNINGQKWPTAIKKEWFFSKNIENRSNCYFYWKKLEFRWRPESNIDFFLKRDRFSRSDCPETAENSNFHTKFGPKCGFLSPKLIITTILFHIFEFLFKFLKIF